MEAFFETTTTYVPAATAPFKLSVAIHKTISKDSNPEQKGPTLFLAHANGFFKEIWHPYLLRLARDGFHGTCVSYDMRNQGDSGLVNNTMKHDLKDYVCRSSDEDGG